MDKICKNCLHWESNTSKEYGTCLAISKCYSPIDAEIIPIDEENRIIYMPYPDPIDDIILETECDFYCKLFEEK